MVERNSLCPVCREKGEFVKNITVKHLILNAIKDSVGDNDYYLCMNEACCVAYFNSEHNIKFNKKELKVPIWFKSDANPKYICYCNKVTEEDIIEAVINKGAKNIKDIIMLTGAMKNGKCEINNPLGKCCSTIIQETIKKGFVKKENSK